MKNKKKKNVREKTRLQIRRHCVCVCIYNIIIRRITCEKNMKNDSYEFNVANARRDVVISAPLTFITFPEIK